MVDGSSCDYLQGDAFDDVRFFQTFNVLDVARDFFIWSLIGLKPVARGNLAQSQESKSSDEERYRQGEEA